MLRELNKMKIERQKALDSLYNIITAGGTSENTDTEEESNKVYVKQTKAKLPKETKDTGHIQKIE